jgi:hypothetical protein
VPLEEYIIDPPEFYEGERFRVPIILEKNGKNHLLFWVGKVAPRGCTDDEGRPLRAVLQGKVLNRLTLLEC